MCYKFTLERVFNYNQELTYSDNDGSISVIVEDVPCKNSTLAVWINEFGPPSPKRDLIIERLKKWAEKQGITLEIDTKNFRG